MVELLKAGPVCAYDNGGSGNGSFAATQGFIDDIPVESVKKFEQEFLRYMNDRKADIRRSLEKRRRLMMPSRQN